jgi:DNA-binding GntR family transcriptional regulator
MTSDQNLREQVLQAVRAEIVSGQSLPGTMYSVPSLAASLGVSTTPVREALLELSRSGLVEPMRNRGFKVVAPSMSDLHNLFAVRGVLEPYAAGVVARQVNQNLDVLHSLAEAVSRAVDENDVREYLEADRCFHRAFNELAGNAILTDAIMGLREKMRLFGIRTNAGVDRQRKSVTEHFQLIELAGAGNAQAIQALMHHHIMAWEPIFAEALSLTIKSSLREPLPPRRSGTG